MSEVVSIFVTVGTLGSLLFFFLVLHMNRRSGRPGQTTGHSYDGIEEFDNPLPAWWYWGFVLTILFAVGYLIYYPGLGNYEGLGKWTQLTQLRADQAAADEKYGPLFAQYRQLSLDELAANERSAKMGRRLYINNCAVCHGSSGQGSFGFPNLTDTEWQWGNSDDSIETTILGGRNGIMTPFDAILSKEQVGEVVDYVMSLTGNETDTAAAARGADHFQLYCVACHGSDGKGNPMFGAPDLTNDIWLYGGSRSRIEHVVRNGRNSRMPAFKDRLGEDKVHLLAGYVRSLSPPSE